MVFNKISGDSSGQPNTHSCSTMNALMILCIVTMEEQIFLFEPRHNRNIFVDNRNLFVSYVASRFQ